MLALVFAFTIPAVGDTVTADDTASSASADAPQTASASTSADSPIQKKFKMTSSYAIKKNKGLYDIETNKKIASNVRSFAKFETGLLIVKTDNTLRYMYRTKRGQYGVAGTAGSWKSKKLLSNVRELAMGTYVSDSDKNGFKYYVYAVRTNGKLVKDTIRLNSNTTAITSHKWKSIMSKVSHAYVSAEGMDEAGTASYYVLKTNGRLYGWGYNEHGEIANGKTTKVKQSSPYLILKNVREFNFAGQTYGTMMKYGTTCYAIKKNGDLYSWGINDFWTVQSGAGEAVTEPIKILDNVKMVDGACHTACAVTNDGVLWNWGTELGNYTVEGVTVTHYGIGMNPVAKNVSYADINMFNLLFIKNNKKLYYMGSSIGNDGKYPTVSKPAYIAKNVTAIYTTDVDGRYYLNNKGYLYGLGVNKGGKFYSKVKLGTGYPK